MKPLKNYNEILTKARALVGKKVIITNRGRGIYRNQHIGTLREVRKHTLPEYDDQYLFLTDWSETTDASGKVYTEGHLQADVMFISAIEEVV